MQKLMNQSIRLEIDHLKIKKCKTYSLLKDADVSSRDSKLKSRAFVSYLIDYNSTNIFRVWNSEKDDISDYRDVIFYTSELYDIYNKSDSLVTLEKKPQIELQTENVKISINQAIELNSDDDEWLEITIRNRLILESKRTVESKSSDQQTTDQQSVDDLIQLLIEFKSSDTFKTELFQKVRCFWFICCEVLFISFWFIIIEFAVRIVW
jgi:hypothetical protein